MIFNLKVDFDQQEALEYRAGQLVEIKARPGVVDIIAEYDPMMVPPIWLANDPKPRYPEELTVLRRPVKGGSWFKQMADLTVAPKTTRKVASVSR